MSKGGMRWGAGRPAWHVKGEHCRNLDVRRLQRAGCLVPGASGIWGWRDVDTGETRASIGYRVEHGRVLLEYAIDGVKASQTINLIKTQCNFGGWRPWFICPIRGDRVAKLYLRSGRFACRHCQRIVYASQSEDLCGRTWRKQQKAEAKLGENWSRPKGMHRTTHERLLQIVWDCEDRRESALAHYVAMLGFEL